MRIGVFGGSFDPVHLGHLILAETVRESASLDLVRFVPAATSPLKPGGPTASGRQRLEMLDLATGGHPNFAVSSIELDRGGTSYTVDTLEQMASEDPSVELFLLIGADSLEQFGKWREPRRICELAIPLVAARRGARADLQMLAPFVSAERYETVARHVIEFPWIEISSTELRGRVAEQQSIRYRVPASVEAYIAHSGLYRDPV
jgi:nicotinate-nucleotide adenylyltransferase